LAFIPAAQCAADKRTGGRSVAADGVYPRKSEARRLRSIDLLAGPRAERYAAPLAVTASLAKVLMTTAS